MYLFEFVRMDRTVLHSYAQLRAEQDKEVL